MSVKKTKKEEIEEIIEEESQVMFKGGDYFTAQIGRIKFRGRVEATEYDYFLANSTVGEAIECADDAINDHGFSKEIFMNGNTLLDLEDEGITNFTVVKDKRITKIIDTDVLPEIAGFRAYKGDDGEVKFGCGAVRYNVKEIKLWYNTMTEIKKVRNINAFMHMTESIMKEGDLSLDEVMDIDLKDVERIINPN